MILRAVTILIGLSSQSAAIAYDACWQFAASRYDIPVIVLKAVAHVESRHNPKAIRKNTNGSTDYGLMQVNTRWLPYIKHFGISEKVIQQPCVNIMVGAWILKQEIIRFGFNWQAIGAYHAGAYTARTKARKLARYINYSVKVYRYINRHRE
ncbi:Putative IpgF protein [hydrothermal vent metagenome]|uniref:IpgF protein n=1 Tax=hydrothermal vent metagenome TaxID=652676 RepID=A0A3B0Z650_9ZZZZ